jgi:hypothetical protein
VVDLEGARRRSEEVVVRLRAESLARVERLRAQRRMSGASALVAAMLAAVLGYGRLEECRARESEQMLAAEAEARRVAAREELERRLAEIQHEMDTQLRWAGSEEDRARIRAQYQRCSRVRPHRPHHRGIQ